MRIVSLTGTQNIDGGENHFSMVVEASGEAYNIPIGFDTYQLLNELAIVLKESAAQLPISQPEQPVFEPPAPEPSLDWEGEQAEGSSNPIEQLQKIGLFEPHNVLDVVQTSASSSEDELMGILEDTSDEDEEDDPGEMSIDDSVGQYPGD